MSAYFFSTSRLPLIGGALVTVAILAGSPAESLAGKVFSAQPTTPPTPIENISASANTSWISGSDQRVPANLINGFGFDGTDFTFPGPNATGLSAGTVTDPSTGFTIPVHDTSDAQTGWLTDQNDVGTAQLDFDLGQVLQIDQAWIWNSPEGDARNTNTVDISYSIDGMTFTPLFDDETIPLLPNGDGDEIGILDFGDVSAQFIRFDDFTSRGDASFVGLGEVIFFQTPPPEIPEPSTFLLGAILLGAAAGYRLWCRRRARQILAG